MKSILRYIGKLNELDISSYIDESIDTYVEPFAGSFNCGFNLIENGFNGKCVLNDLDRYIVTFWECIKEDPEKLFNLICTSYERYVTSGENLELLKASQDKYCQATFEYLYSTTMDIFNNKTTYKKLDTNLVQFLCTQELLQNVEITCLDYKEVIKRYDGTNTMIVLDPPYNVDNINRYYRLNCKDFDHEELRDYISNLKSKWILRYRKNDYIDKLYKDYKVLFETHKNILGNDIVQVYYGNI